MTKYKKFLKFIYTFCGAFGFIAYFSYLIKLFIWPEGTLPLIVAILGTIISGVPVIFRKWFECHLPKKLFSFLENLFGWGMLFYCVTFIALSTFIFTAPALQAEVEELPEKTVFIVYGAGLEGDSPGSILRKRLDKTVECMTELPESVCIVTGGQGADEPVTEASAMKEYLAEKGIDGERIILEEQAHNTIDNIRYSFELIEKERLGGYAVVSVSNSFHIPRIDLICSRLGVESRFVLAKDPNPYTLFTVLVREYMSYAKLFLVGTEA